MTEPFVFLTFPQIFIKVLCQNLLLLLLLLCQTLKFLLSFSSLLTIGFHGLFCIGFCKTFSKAPLSQNFCPKTWFSFLFFLNCQNSYRSWPFFVQFWPIWNEFSRVWTSFYKRGLDIKYHRICFKMGPSWCRS